MVFEYLRAYARDPAEILPDRGQIAAIAGVLLAYLQPDGTWRIPWKWNAYPAEWAVAENWWKAYGIVVNMRFLRENGFLPEPMN